LLLADELIAMLLLERFQQLHGFLTTAGIGIFASGAGGGGKGPLQMVGCLGVFTLVGE
jgi:hypothetical protein